MTPLWDGLASARVRVRARYINIGLALAAAGDTVVVNVRLTRNERKYVDMVGRVGLLVEGAVAAERVGTDAATPWLLLLLLLGLGGVGELET